MHQTPAEVIESDPRRSPQRTIWFVHGVLGQGRNWRSFARRALALVDGPARAVLPDLRGHGAHPRRPGPHTLDAAAADLQELADDIGPPDVLVGHSLGGKIVIACLAGAQLPPATIVWSLDSPPGVDPAPARGEAHDPALVLELLRSSPVPAASRDEIRAYLASAGLPPAVVAWLLTSLHREPGGWRWVYDLEAIASLLGDHHRRDLWPVVQAAGSRIQLVHAGAGGRWSPAELRRASRAAAEHRVGLHTLPRAGHWLHVDDPEGVLALLRPSLQAPL